MKSVKMDDKIELTALQLVYLLSDTIEEALKRAGASRRLEPMVIASKKTKEIFNRKWATISEKEKIEH